MRKITFFLSEEINYVNQYLCTSLEIKILQFLKLLNSIVSFKSDFKFLISKSYVIHTFHFPKFGHKTN